ncbi:protein of unknown function [Methanoculleus bourgensis]|uniref:Uncharacterized protein n=1 Tax=Methanoculleus bourgensis TaxID=83986 RepID=A0A0X3BLM5_9EURY|nr:protein of unknown function [Methanoculleus bourgensis]
MVEQRQTNENTSGCAHTIPSDRISTLDDASPLYWSISLISGSWCRSPPHARREGRDRKRKNFAVSRESARVDEMPRETLEVMQNAS